MIPPMPGTPGVPPAPEPSSELAYLDLTVQGNRFTSNVIPPHVTVNGHPLVDAYGYRRVPVHAGPVRIDVECRWTRTFGQATMMLTIPPGQVVPVFYAAPMSVFSKGSIGHEKQKRTGMVIMLVVVALAIAIPVAIGVASAFSAM